MSSLRRFKPYPAYKDSGVEWLEEIPAHWIVKPLKRALRSGNADGSLIKGRMHQEPGEGLFPGFSASGQDIWVEEAQHHEPGIVLSAVGARCGKTFKADEHWTAVANTHVIFPHSGFDRDFLWYLTNDETFWDRGGTAQPFVRVSSTLQRPWCFPSLNEQRAIAAFLDRETARIDALVAKKERVIELLQEQRTALITRAVTKGLDPNVPMKDSGVEWLGEIPAHWTVKRVRQACSRVTDGAHISPDTSSADFPFVSTVDIRGGVIDFDGCLRTSHASYSYMERTGCRPKDGDVLFSKDGTVGTTALVTTDRAFAVASSLVILSPTKSEVDARWLNYWLNGVFIKDQVELLLSGAALRRISVAKVGRLPVLLPPNLDEQHPIADFLDRETARIDALVAKVRDAIDRLKELRTALISAAVTGKIDVREEVA